jgi:hypothetical protein
MIKEDKEWEEILGKYQNENDSSIRYMHVYFVSNFGD